MSLDVQQASLCIERIVSRDFAAEERTLVQNILAKYGTKPHHVERDRVRLCVLKLARGDLRKLERQITVASTDFRDVVGAAEYPRQLSVGFSGFDRMNAAERALIEEDDRQQYSDWLDR